MVKEALVDRDTLIIDLGSDHLVLSTAGCPQVYSTTRYVVFKRVPGDFNVIDVDRYCRELANSIGVDRKLSTLFLTAADVSAYTHATFTHDGVRANVYVTFGIDEPLCLDHVKGGTRGTINVAVIVDKPLSPVGLLDLFRLVSEVKGMVMALGGPLCTSGASVGTASDATAVAAPMGTETFAGLGTSVGIASAVATVKALSRHLRAVSSEEYLVKSLGLNNLEELLEIAMRVYKKAEVPQINDAQAKAELRAELALAARDPNIVAFVRGLKLLEAALALGVVPLVSLEEYLSDSPGLVVDELAGKSLAEYINGFRGLLAYYWVEKLKERGEVEEIRTLPPITDDLVSALVGGALSKVYDRYARS